MGFRDYLDLELDDKRSIGDGSQERYNCPFCPSNNDFKMYVRATNDEKDGLWDCKKCGRKGNPVSFVMEYNSVGYREARDILEMYMDDDMLTISYREQGLSDTEILYLLMLDKTETKSEEAEEPLVAPKLPTGLKLIMNNLNNPEVYPFVDYLVNKRNLPPEIIEKHNIGYITQGYIETQKGKRVGLNNHIIFFTYNDNGEYIYWNTRSIENNPYLKSINAIAGDGEYSKSTVVYNLNIAKRTGKIVIVEGVMDALTIGDSGVATFGKQVSNRQINDIVKGISPETEIYVMLDRDAPEQADALALKLYEKHKNTFIVLNPDNGDANDLGHDRTWEIINNHSISANSEKRLLLMF